MSNGTQVLREYLLALGFKINTVEQKKFDSALVITDKLAKGAGASLVGVGTAAAAMVTIFANQMEKLYYASRRTGSTVENLQALQFSAKQIGISGDQIQGAITNMARSLRNNPGLVGLLKSLGVAVEGRDTSDVMRDMVRQLRQMPFYVGSKFASMFGMDEDTFLLMSQGLEKMDEMAAKRKQMNADAGVNADEAAKAAVEYNNLIGSVLERVSVLKDALAIALLPTMKSAAAYADELLLSITKIIRLKDVEAAKELGLRVLGDVQKNNTASGFGAEVAKLFQRFGVGNGFTIGDHLRGLGHGGAGYGRAQMVGGGRGFVNPDFVNPGAGGAGSVGQGASGGKALLSALEKQYGLPNGLLHAMRMAESGGNDRAVGPNTKYGTAKGPFQLIDATAKEYGVSDPFDINQAGPAAAKKMAGLIKMYGDLSQALAAWNYGEGNFASVGNKLGAAPAETRGFVPKVMGGMQQTNVFHIATSDPRAAAEAVGQRLDQANAQHLQNMGSVVQ